MVHVLSLTVWLICNVAIIALRPKLLTSQFWKDKVHKPATSKHGNMCLMLLRDGMPNEQNVLKAASVLVSLQHIVDSMDSNRRISNPFRPVFGFVFTNPIRLNGVGALFAAQKIYNGRLVVYCRATGIFYWIIHDKLVPWVILQNPPSPDYSTADSVWMTIKDELLFVGETGNEFFIDGNLHLSHRYIKIIDKNGLINFVDWKDNYLNIYEEIKIRIRQISFSLRIETMQWSPKQKKWIIVIQVVSELWKAGMFFIMNCADTFIDFSMFELNTTNVDEAVHFGRLEGFPFTAGNTVQSLTSPQYFTAFQFWPDNTEFKIVAVKVIGEKSYLTKFNINGQVIIHDTEVAPFILSSFEFVPCN